MSLNINKNPSSTSTPQCETLSLPLGLRVLRRLPIPHKLGVLERLYGRKLNRYGHSWVSCSNDIKWKLDLSDSCHRWIVYGDYEGSIFLDWVRLWLRNGGVFLDSGANIGQMLLYVAPMPGVRALAFEPLPEAMQWLAECVSNYKNEWQVTLIDKGLSDQASRVTLQQAGAQSTMRDDWYLTKELKMVEIQVDTLDHQLMSFGIDRVRLWKLDVEGVEVQVLRGARASLEAQVIDAILIEVCAPNLNEVNGVLAEANYRLFSLRDKGNIEPVGTELSGTTNLIALSPRAQSEISI